MKRLELTGSQQLRMFFAGPSGKDFLQEKGYEIVVGIGDVLNGRQPQWQKRLVQTAVGEKVQ